MIDVLFRLLYEITNKAGGGEADEAAKDSLQ
jgi:hypothetical protein